MRDNLIPMRSDKEMHAIRVRNSMARKATSQPEILQALDDLAALEEDLRIKIGWDKKFVMPEICISCTCGNKHSFNYMSLEHGTDTYIDERDCNGVSCDYYGCPDEFCYSEYPKVKVAKEFVRWNCPECGRVAECVLLETILEKYLEES